MSECGTTPPRRRLSAGRCAKWISAQGRSTADSHNVGVWYHMSESQGFLRWTKQVKELATDAFRKLFLGKGVTLARMHTFLGCAKLVHEATVIRRLASTRGLPDELKEPVEALAADLPRLLASVEAGRGLSRSYPAPGARRRTSWIRRNFDLSSGDPAHGLSSRQHTAQTLRSRRAQGATSRATPRRWTSAPARPASPGLLGTVALDENAAAHFRAAVFSAAHGTLARRRPPMGRRVRPRDHARDGERDGQVRRRLPRRRGFAQEDPFGASPGKTGRSPQMRGFHRAKP